LNTPGTFTNGAEESIDLTVSASIDWRMGVFRTSSNVNVLEAMSSVLAISECNYLELRWQDGINGTLCDNYRPRADGENDSLLLWRCLFWSVMTCERELETGSCMTRHAYAL
jgi:hypothetical protein